MRMRTDLWKAPARLCSCPPTLTAPHPSQAFIAARFGNGPTLTPLHELPAPVSGPLHALAAEQGFSAALALPGDAALAPASSGQLLLGGLAGLPPRPPSGTDSGGSAGSGGSGGFSGGGAAAGPAAPTQAMQLAKRLSLPADDNSSPSGGGSPRAGGDGRAPQLPSRRKSRASERAAHS